MANTFRVDEFRSSKPLSVAVFGLFGLQIVALVLTVLMSVGLLASPDWTVDLDDGGTMPIFMVFIGLGEILRIVAFIASVVVFLIWEYRAFSNLSPLKARNLEFSPGWAVGWWFIPFANLVKPYQAMKELWSGSSPEFNEDLDYLPSGEAIPSVFSFWWALWILYSIGARIVDRAFDANATDFSNLALGELVVSSLGIIACMLAIFIVRDITSRQTERCEKLTTLNQNVPPPPPIFDGVHNADAAI
jgi:hypothetical protein